MASSAVGLQQVQAQLRQSFYQIQSLSVETAAMNTKIDFLNTDRIAKDGQVANLLSANRQLSDAMQCQRASQSMGRGQNDVRLIDMKAMNP